MPRLHWSSLIEDNPNTEEVIFDRKGKDGALRIAVQVADLVRLSSFKEKVKRFAIEKSEKELDADMQAMRKKELVVTDPRDAEDAAGTAALMVRSGSAGNCFAGHAFDVDLQALQNQVTEEMNDKDAEAEPEQSGSGEKTDDPDDPADDKKKRQRNVKTNKKRRGTGPPMWLQGSGQSPLCFARLRFSSNSAWQSAEPVWQRWPPRARHARKKPRLSGRPLRSGCPFCLLSSRRTPRNCRS